MRARRAIGEGRWLQESPQPRVQPPDDRVVLDSQARRYVNRIADRAHWIAGRGESVDADGVLRGSDQVGWSGKEAWDGGKMGTRRMHFHLTERGRKLVLRRRREPVVALRTGTEANRSAERENARGDHTREKRAAGNGCVLTGFGVQSRDHLRLEGCAQAKALPLRAK